MDKFIFLTEFFGGLILGFAIGWAIGHLLKLEKKIDEMYKK